MVLARVSLSQSQLVWVNVWPDQTVYGLVGKRLSDS